MLLSEIEKGKRYRIKRINSNEQTKKRLQSFGIGENSVIELVRYSLLNNPVLYKVKNVNIALRIEDAKKIEVEKYENSVNRKSE